MSPQELLAQLHWRYATKSFDQERRLSPTEIQWLAEVLRLTPSSFGLQLWKFVFVEDKALRLQLRKASWNQDQVETASVYIVFCRPSAATVEHVDHFVDSVADARGQSRQGLQAYRDMMVQSVAAMDPEQTAHWMEKQLYIALGNLLTSCASVGLDACPMEGFDKSAYNEILGLSDKGLVPVVACAVGHRSSADRYANIPKVRFPIQQLVLRL